MQEMYITGDLHHKLKQDFIIALVTEQPVLLVKVFYITIYNCPTRYSEFMNNNIHICYFIMSIFVYMLRTTFMAGLQLNWGWNATSQN